MMWREPAAKSVQRVKLAEIRAFKKVRPATKEGVAHATDKFKFSNVASKNKEG